MARGCAESVLGGNPLLTMLGRRGRGEVVDVLRSAPGPWTVRGLADRAGVPHQVAGRALRELEALGVVEIVRPGRNMHVQWRAGTPAADFLAGLQVPDLRALAGEAFAAALAGHRTLRWTRTPQEAGDPSAPTRIAIVHEDADTAMEAAAAGLDAVLGTGLPRIDVSTITPEALRSDDPVAGRIRGAAS